jgi:2-keto-4-pentenoate hydratase
MPMTDQDVSTFAAALLAARRHGAEPATVPNVVPATDAEAYRVQDQVMKELGPVEGWKVGAASPSSEPNCAPVLNGGIITSTTKPIVVPAKVGIEVEIAFRMRRAFPSATEPPEPADILAGIGSAHVAMELCASRMATGQQSPGLCNLADNGMNLGFVIGPEVANWQAIDASRQVARAMVGDKVAVETAGGHTQKDIARLLIWLVGHVVTQRGGLKDGTIVATGSWTGLHWVTAPTKVGGQFPGVGQMQCSLVAP